MNPAHMEDIPHGENVRRGVRKEFCRRGHKMVETRVVSKSGRSCCGVCWEAYKKRKKIAI